MRQGGRKHVIFAVSKLWSIGVLLRVRVVDHLIQGTLHGHLVREIGGKSSIEVHRASLEMGCESSILHWEAILLFVNFFIHNILLCYTKRPARSTFVDFGRTSC
jgi:hypothetical protein